MNKWLFGELREKLWEAVIIIVLLCCFALYCLLELFKGEVPKFKS